MIKNTGSPAGVWGLEGQMAIVAVVGGTGFLGRHVVAALENEGYSVRVLSRRTGFDGLAPSPEQLRGVHAVVNLAGIKREEGEQTFDRVHVVLVRRLIEAMKAAGVRRLVHISVVVARPAADLPYHDTKWRGEVLVRDSGLEWTILRPGVIYGEGDDMLSHLGLMIRAAPIFPIVGAGNAPMRPVDVRDVARAVVATLEKPCAGKTYDIVGPDRLTLREVVTRVATAMDLPVRICRTPVRLMQVPVWIMESTMRQPLSTRAQLAMLAEGLDGDPRPARQDLAIETSPFSTHRLSGILPNATSRKAPFTLRLFSAIKHRSQIPAAAFAGLLAFALVTLPFVFLTANDIWLGMFAAMSLSLAGTILVPAIRRRFKPSLARTAAGLCAGLLLFALTHVAAGFLGMVWPEWKVPARVLYAWAEGHSPVFLGFTLPVIVVAEEFLWRGIVTGFLMGRLGTVAGITSGAVIYALAHVAAFNPLLVLAAFGCGLFWGLLYAQTDDLVLPTVSHLLWDVLILFAFPIV